MTRILITAIIVLSFLSIDMHAQKEHIHMLKNVKCEHQVLIDENFSTKDIQEELRVKCKEKALEQVTSEVFKSWSDLVIVNSDNGQESESLNSLVNYNTSSRDGEIVEFNIVKEGRDIIDGTIVFYCIADAKVKTGIAPDPTFIVPVKGVKSVYMSGEELHFSFIPYKECYMMLFLIENERTGYMLLPNQYVREQKYMAEEEYKLNENSRSYIEFSKNPNVDIEYNKLIFLFTTRKWAFDKDSQSSKEIVEWIARIPNNEKFIHQQIIEIREK